MNKFLVQLFLQQSLIKMSQIDMHYWTGKTSIQEWTNQTKALSDEMYKTLAAMEPARESDVV